MKKLALSVLVLALSAAAMLGFVEASRDSHAGPAVLLQADAGVAAIEPMPDASVLDAIEAGSAAPAVTVNAAPGSTVNVSPLPDPVADPGGAIEALTALYTRGALTPFFYLLGFFMLVYAERKIAWLSVGYRKVAVSALLYAAGMLAERAIAGTTPTAAMVVTAIGGAALFAFKAVGPKST